MNPLTKAEARAIADVCARRHGIEKRLYDELTEAETKAWDSLARYKFQMFGYWAAIWVHTNRVGGFKKPNPFKSLVTAARNNNTDSHDTHGMAN